MGKRIAGVAQNCYHGYQEYTRKTSSFIEVILMGIDYLIIALLKDNFYFPVYQMELKIYFV